MKQVYNNDKTHRQQTPGAAAGTGAVAGAVAEQLAPAPPGADLAKLEAEQMSWISALAELQQRGEACVLVTIIEEQGSTPRNSGSKMVVSAERIFETIGGGHLEYKAMQLAREMLASRSQDTRLERFSLG